eukprot:gene4635-3763_t
MSQRGTVRVRWATTPPCGPTCDDQWLEDESISKVPKNRRMREIHGYELTRDVGKGGAMRMPLQAHPLRVDATSPPLVSSRLGELPIRFN